MHRVYTQLLWIVTAVSVLAVPMVASAAVEISEIMYSPEGADGGLEWVEVHNTGDQSVTITNWNLRENQTDHRISAVNGGKTVSAGSFAVLADDPAQFSQKFNASGPVFDSAFSLNNSGESLVLVGPEGSSVNSVSYPAQDAADGTGRSLQLSEGSWIAADPTAGGTNASKPADTSSKAKGEEQTRSDDDRQSAGGVTQVLKPRDESGSEVAGAQDTRDTRTVVDAGQDKEVIAGVQAHLIGTVQAGTHVDDPDPRWSLGNGDTKDGADIFYAYDHPGTYVATLIADGKAGQQTDQITVEVSSPKLSITDTQAGEEGFIKITNDLQRNIDLSGWHLRAHGETFTIPPYTIVQAGSTLAIANKASGLTPSGGVGLLYPNGTVADTHTPTQTQTQPGRSDATGNSSATDSTHEADQHAGNVLATNDTNGTDQAAKESTESDTNKATETSLSTLFATPTDQVGAAGEANNADWMQWVSLVATVIVAGAGVTIYLQRATLGAGDPDKVAEDFDINEL